VNVLLDSTNVFSQSKAKAQSPSGQALQQLPQELIFGTQPNLTIWGTNATRGGGSSQQVPGQQQQQGQQITQGNTVQGIIAVAPQHLYVQSQLTNAHPQQAIHQQPPIHHTPICVHL